MKSLESIVYFDHEEYGFSDEIVLSLFPAPINIQFAIQSEVEERALLQFAMHDPFFIPFEDLIELAPPLKRTQATAGVFVDGPDEMKLPEFNVIQMPEPVTPKFEF